MTSKITRAIMTLAAAWGMMACNGTDDELPASKLYFANGGRFEVAPGDTVVFRPRITYDQNTTYTWTQNGQQVSDQKNFTFCQKAMKDYELFFEMTNDRGYDSAHIYISVQKHVTCSGLPGLKKRGGVTMRLVPDTLGPCFYHDSTIVFSNAVNADTTDWYGFAHSSRNQVQTSINAQAKGTAHITSGTEQGQKNEYMAMSCNNPLAPAVITFGREYTAKSIDVANDNLSFLLCRNGGLAISGTDTTEVRPMTEGDYLRLDITGYDAQNHPTATVEYYLLDYRNGKTQNVFRLDRWATIDLRSLGAVSRLGFTMTSTREHFALNACIDNLKLQDP